jgi:hypothetical protein
LLRDARNRNEPGHWSKPIIAAARSVLARMFWYSGAHRMTWGSTAPGHFLCVRPVAVPLTDELVARSDLDRPPRRADRRLQRKSSGRFLYLQEASLARSAALKGDPYSGSLSAITLRGDPYSG